MSSMAHQSEVRPAPAQTGQKRDRVTAGFTHHVATSAPRPVLPVESDSLNENNFPASSGKPVRERDRTTTKRKRKCKRIALDPEQAGKVTVSPRRLGEFRI